MSQFSDRCTNKDFAGFMVWKITFRETAFFINTCCCQPDPPAGGEGSVALRSDFIPLRRDKEPQCDSTFSYNCYINILLFIMAILSKFAW